MSCRLLRSDAPGAAPLFQQRRDDEHNGTPQPWLGGRPESKAEPTENASELQALRRRIRELEAAAVTKTEEVRATAFRQGQESGYEQAAAIAKPVLERLTASITAISSVRSRMRAEAERDLVVLSLAIARRVLRREVSVDPDAVQGLVRAALEKLQARDIVRVRVAPDQEAAIRRGLAAANAGTVEVSSDPTLGSGDVLVETLRGNLDASMETQLIEIERGFTDRLR